MSAKLLLSFQLERVHKTKKGEENGKMLNQKKPEIIWNTSIEQETKSNLPLTMIDPNLATFFNFCVNLERWRRFLRIAAGISKWPAH